MLEHPDLGVFEEIFASWSRVLSQSRTDEIRLANFRRFCSEAVGYFDRGLARGDATERLGELASNHDMAGLVDVEEIIRKAFEPQPESPRAMGPNLRRSTFCFRFRSMARPSRGAR